MYARARDQGLLARIALRHPNTGPRIVIGSQSWINLATTRRLGIEKSDANATSFSLRNRHRASATGECGPLRSPSVTKAYRTFRRPVPLQVIR